MWNAKRVIRAAAMPVLLVFWCVVLYTKWPFSLFPDFIRDYMFPTVIMASIAGLCLAVLALVVDFFPSQREVDKSSGWRIWLCLIGAIFVSISYYRHVISHYFDRSWLTLPGKEYASFARSTFLCSTMVTYCIIIAIHYAVKYFDKQKLERMV